MAPERDRAMMADAVKLTIIVRTKRASPSAIRADRPNPDASL
jgi:hypothetical protein